MVQVVGEPIERLPVEQAMGEIEVDVADQRDQTMRATNQTGFDAKSR